MGSYLILLVYELKHALYTTRVELEATNKVSMCGQWCTRVGWLINLIIFNLNPFCWRDVGLSTPFPDSGTKYILASD